jgi:hypothetical protein
LKDALGVVGGVWHGTRGKSIENRRQMMNAAMMNDELKT